MTDYQQRYTERGIPLYDPASSAPYDAANAPREGWYIIEVAGESDISNPQSRDKDRDDDPPRDCIEAITPDTLQTLARNFDPTTNGGKGLLVNRDHLCLRGDVETRAEGWVKALDADGDKLAAYIKFTPGGHNLVLNEEYWGWSTEYPHANYRHLGGNRYEPTYLSGVALTNTPHHDTQPGISHARTLPLFTSTNQKDTNMATKIQRRVTHSDDANKQLDDLQTNSDDAKKDDTSCNSDEDQKDDTQTNSDPDNKDETQTNSDDGWDGIIDQIAAALGVGDEATGDEIVAAVVALKQDFDALKASSDGTQTNSRRSPRMVHNKGAQRMDNKVIPQGDVVVHTITGKEARVPRKDVDIVTHCNKAIADERRTLGRNLTPGEHRRVWAAAAASFGGK